MLLLWWTLAAIICLGWLVEVWMLKHCEVTLRRSSVITIGWFLAAVIFLELLWYRFGCAKSLEFLASYVLELTLSIDNLFVFFAVMSYFSVRGQLQQLALMYGVCIAVALRIGIALGGLSLIGRFGWLIYVLGVLLVITGIKTIKSHSSDEDLDSRLELFCQRFKIRRHVSARFFERSEGHWYVTTFLVCIIVTELLDFLCALDSISAILTVSRSELIVISADILAVMALRSLFAFISQLTEKFSLLRFAAGINLIFMGLKMLMQKYIEIPTLPSIAFIVGTVLIAMIVPVVRRHSKS